MDETKTLLPIGEVARRFGVSVDTVRRWVKEGRITAVVLPSGHRRFEESEVQARLAAHQ